VPARISRELAWQKIEGRLANAAASGKQISVDLALFLKIAASFLTIALTAYLVYNQHHVDLITNSGERRLITLPDHSTVLLNACSSLHYNTLLFPMLRRVYFEGEGFFTVEKGNRFTVISKSGTVEVLGTQFNVMSRTNAYEVACLDGKVKVSNSRNSSEVLLTPGLQTSLSNDEMKQPYLLQAETISWKNDEFYFDNALLADVINTLSLQYNIKVELNVENLPARHYTGYFTKYNLAESLELICLPLGLEYKIQNSSQVTISSKKLTIKPKSK
jgi:transmembrane sensor